MTSPCPVCDHPLELSIARARQVACSGCQSALQPLRMPSALRRISAAALDALFVGLLAAPWWLWKWLGPQTDGRGLVNRVLDVLAEGPWVTFVQLWPLAALIVAYSGLFVWLLGRTPGQQLCSIRVVDRCGCTPHAVLSFARALALVLTNLPLGLGAAWSLFDVHGQSVHDRLTQTFLSKEP